MITDIIILYTYVFCLIVYSNMFLFRSKFFCSMVTLEKRIMMIINITNVYMSSLNLHSITMLLEILVVGDDHNV